MEFLKKLWKNDYVRNIIYAVGGIVALVTVAMLFLNVYTRHGQSQPVPDFKGLSIKTAYELADEHDLRIEVSDSIFRQALPPGSVIDQTPKSTTMVKKNRKIFLMINCVMPKQIDAPNVVGFSLRQGKAVLESRGLRVGKLRYQSDIATNNILEQQYKGHSLAPKDRIYMGSEVDLVLGLSESGGSTNVPNILRKNADAARSGLADASLNLGRSYYDKTVRTAADSLNAVVYKQSPVSRVSTPLGSSVDIYLTIDETKLPK